MMMQWFLHRTKNEMSLTLLSDYSHNSDRVFKNPKIVCNSYDGSVRLIYPYDYWY